MKGKNPNVFVTYLSWNMWFHNLILRSFDYSFFSKGENCNWIACCLSCNARNHTEIIMTNATEVYNWSRSATEICEIWMYVSLYENAESNFEIINGMLQIIKILPVYFCYKEDSDSIFDSVWIELTYLYRIHLNVFQHFQNETSDIGIYLTREDLY